jgi:hypothetical protein
VDFLKRSFDLFIYTSLFIACGAVLMAWQSFELFNIHINLALLGFIFSGTICSYNFHWYLAPPQNEILPGKKGWNQMNRKLHLVLSVSGLAAAIYFAFELRSHALFLFITAIFTFLYSAPKIPLKSFRFCKQLMFGKTFYLALAWTHVTVILPLVTANNTFDWGSWLFILNRFTFIYIICLLFDYRDRREDREQNIRSLVTLLPEKNLTFVFYSCIFIFFTSLLLLAPYLEFPAVLALGLPGLIISLLYSYFKTHTSDFLYYFILDGIMILSAPLVVLAKFAR